MPHPYVLGVRPWKHCQYCIEVKQQRAERLTADLWLPKSTSMVSSIYIQILSPSPSNLVEL